MTDTQKALAYPKYWLLFGREWPVEVKSGPAECGVATIPGFIPRGHFSRDTDQVLDTVGAYAKQHPDVRLVMFGEVSHWLGDANTDWASMGVDWEGALEELANAPIPQLLLNLNQWGHLLLSTIGIPKQYVHFPDGSRRLVERSEYETLRAQLTTLLEEEWPRYIVDTVPAS
ncbi:hypothetical protein [Saccharopolyspora shandongensis]|uniref:hypothetical protein n=1 Tax=Saccharopolyspora shandongensis TaxID=418495 RepID=UPI0034008EE9